MELRERYASLKARGVDVMVVGPDGPDAFRSYFEREKLPFRGIPDRGGTLLGLLGQEQNWIKFGRLPAVLAIDPEGRVLARHMSRSARDLPDLGRIADALTQAQT